MGRMELRIVMIRDDRKELLQNGPRGRGILGEFVEQPNALLMFECREEREEALEVL